jgi:hypothetical protein
MKLMTSGNYSRRKTTVNNNNNRSSEMPNKVAMKEKQLFTQFKK